MDLRFRGDDSKADFLFYSAASGLGVVMIDRINPYHSGKIESFPR